jgi:hypothetical protein
MMVMVMVKAKLEDQTLQLGKEEKRKTKIKEIETKVLNRFLFWHSRHHRGCECIKNR